MNRFQDYFYHTDPDITVKNMKNGQLSYLLVDLNAATIDNDPAQHLTKRVENMFATFTSDNLTLIETDSICLKLGLDLHKQDGDMTKYLQISTVNHSSQI